MTSRHITVNCKITKERAAALTRCRSITTSLPYEQLALEFSPLDLILFRGSDFVSNTIGFLERQELGAGDFTHVGLLVNSEILPTIPELEKGKWYVWESTFSATEGFMKKFSDGIPNVLTGEGKFGVQIRDFEQVTVAYRKGTDAKVAWAKLLHNPWLSTAGDPEARLKLVARVSSIHKLYGNRTYNANFLSLLASLFPCLRTYRDVFEKVLVDGHTVLTTLKIRPKDPDNPGVAGWLFCSQLVALIYQRLELIPQTFDTDDVVPIDFIGYDQDGLPKLVAAPVYINGAI